MHWFVLSVAGALVSLTGCGAPSSIHQPLPASSIARFQPPAERTPPQPPAAATAPARPTAGGQTPRVDARSLALDPGATDRLSGTTPPPAAARAAAAPPARTTWQREHEYCDDYAHRVHLAMIGVPGASRFARQNAYEDCMAGFARFNRFLER